MFFKPCDQLLLSLPWLHGTPWHRRYFPGDPTGCYTLVKDHLVIDASVPVDPVATPEKPEGTVRFVCVSDTHGHTPVVPGEFRGVCLGGEGVSRNHLHGGR